MMVFDLPGQADNYESRIEICQRSYDILVELISSTGYHHLNIFQ
jgi:5-methyltetrahydrofolate--homocysteine methyltransferase